MVGGERDGLAATAEHRPRVAAIGDDNFLRSDDGDHRRGTDGVALRRLEFAAAGDANAIDVAIVPCNDLLVHAREASLHHALPSVLSAAVEAQLFLHHLVEPLLALGSYLKLINSCVNQIKHRHISKHDDSI